MIGRAFNPQRTDSLLIDLEGWNLVLDAMGACEDQVEPGAIRVVSNAITACVRELRDATDTADKSKEGTR